MRKFVRNILLFVNLLLAVLLVVSWLSVRINPETAWIFAFFALAYPFFIIVNLLFVIWWMLFRKWYFIFSLLAIVLGWHALQASFQVKFKKPQVQLQQPAIDLLTYNVRLFNYYQWNKDTSSWQKIINHIHKEKPDIVCFQEFITLPGTHHDLDNLKKQMAPLTYSHVYYTDHLRKKLNFGMATFSRYPIVAKKMIDFKESLNGSIYSDIVVRGDTIRVFNCHLQSIRFRKDYNDLVDSIIFNYSEKQLDELKDISVRMRQAYIQRAGQVDIMKGYIRTSPYPVIICGDFNDTPVSYTYDQLSKGLKDAFIVSGSGTGTTFRGNFPYVRIDYVFCSPVFHPVNYNTENVEFSDHFPVKVSFAFNEMADSSGQHSPPKE